MEAIADTSAAIAVTQAPLLEVAFALFTNRES
jgi:hypothetical protein